MFDIVELILIMSNYISQNFIFVNNKIWRDDAP